VSAEKELSFFVFFDLHNCKNWCVKSCFLSFSFMYSDWVLEKHTFSTFIFFLIVVLSFQSHTINKKNNAIQSSSSSPSSGRPIGQHRSWACPTPDSNAFVSACCGAVRRFSGEHWSSWLSFVWKSRAYLDAVHACVTPSFEELCSSLESSLGSKGVP
jgi:hypothetical protein